MSTEIKAHSYQKVLYSLVGLLLLLNLAIFWSYHVAHTTQSLSLQIWEYLNSGVFKLVSASLILPIILFVLESKFKLAETISKNLEERRRMEDQAHSERIELERRDRKSRRFEALSESIKWWDDLYDLSAEITYFTKPKGHQPIIEDLLKRIRRMTFTGEDIVNTWQFRFPNLVVSDIDVCVAFFNVLLKSSLTVAECIRSGVMTSEEIEVLKDCLGVILQGSKTIAHHSILTVLRLSSDLLDLDEAENQNGRADLERGRESALGNLRDWAGSLRDLEKTQNKLFASIRSDKAQALRSKCESFWQRIRNNPKDLSELNEVRSAFSSIPIEDRVRAQRIFYSPEYVKSLADFMGFITLRVQLTQ